MTDKQLDKLIRRKANLAYKMEVLRAELDEAIEARYETHPGEVDCDPAIDSLDYGLGPDYTLEKLDADMAACGAPKKSPNEKLTHSRE